jgi:hypothetical protein
MHGIYIMTRLDYSKFVGGKRKNGHKISCKCHICENMKNKANRGGYTEDSEKQSAGSTKKNGHKMNCKCPICKNMMNAKRGGKTEDSSSDEEEEPDLEETDTAEEEVVEEDTDSDVLEGGKRKGNGHKKTCTCPICKNMRKKGGDGVEVVAKDEEYGTMMGGKKSKKRRSKRKSSFRRKTLKHRRSRGKR